MLKVKDIEDLDASAVLKIETEVELAEVRDLMGKNTEFANLDDLYVNIREWLFDNIYQECNYAVSHGGGIFDDIEFDITILTKKGNKMEMIFNGT
jgi:hypothetical protein